MLPEVDRHCNLNKGQRTAIDDTIVTHVKAQEK